MSAHGLGRRRQSQVARLVGRPEPHPDDEQPANSNVISTRPHNPDSTERHGRARITSPSPRGATATDGDGPPAAAGTAAAPPPAEATTTVPMALAVGHRPRFHRGRNRRTAPAALPHLQRHLPDQQPPHQQDEPERDDPVQQHSVRRARHAPPELHQRDGDQPSTTPKPPGVIGSVAASWPAP